MNKANLIVRILMWLLWLYLAAALPFYWIFLVGDIPGETTFGSVDIFTASLYFIPLIITIVLRWFVIPRIKLFPLTIIPFFFGVVLAQSMTFFGIFLVDSSYCIIFLATSVLALLQFLPIFNMKKG
jgi:hypothetical protein